MMIIAKVYDQCNRKISIYFVVCILFVLVTLLVPTVYPFKNLLLILFLLFFIFRTTSTNTNVSKMTLQFVLSFVPSLLSMCINGSNYVVSISLIFIPVVFLFFQTTPVYLMIRMGMKTNEQIYKFLYFTYGIGLILCMILLYEAVEFNNIYYNVFGVSSLDPEIAEKVLSVYSDSNINKMFAFGVEVRRPYGPFRYQLLAGFSLILPAFINVYLLISTKKAKKILYTSSLFVYMCVFFLTSKGVLLSFIVSLNFLILKTPLISKVKKISLLSLGFVVLVGFIYILVLMPLNGYSFGSFLERSSRICSALSVFADNSLFTIFFGHGFSFTWYGNPSFVEKYSEAPADIGFYTNSLLEGGLTGFVLIVLFFMSVVKKFVLIKPILSIRDALLREVLCCCLISYMISFLVISNVDIIFWLFVVMGCISQLETIHREYLVGL